MKDEEHKIQVALMEWMKLKHPKFYEWTYAVPNGGKRHISVAKKLKAEGVKAGVPDICIAYPLNGFHGLYIELKKEKGRPTESQLEWLNKLGSVGYMAVICKGLDSAMDQINAYLEQEHH